MLKTYNGETKGDVTTANSPFYSCCLVAWPFSGIETKGDLALINTLLLFTCKSCCSHANYFVFTKSRNCKIDYYYTVQLIEFLYIE